MTHAPHEEAEHASHHGQDPFDKRIALTMVVVAALLAGVKILGHRAHNATLSDQIKANVSTTKASNAWNYYQAKKNRQYLYEAEADLLALLSAKATAPVDLPEDPFAVLAPAPKEDARQPEKAQKKKGELSEEDRKKVEELVKAGLPEKNAERIVTWRSQAASYGSETQEIDNKAREADDKTDEALEDSKHKHHQSAYFDLGELFVELALVLCSVAILVRLKGFWFGGMAVCVLGVVIVLFGFLPSGH
jgi:hypothetical protein